MILRYLSFALLLTLLTGCASPNTSPVMSPTGTSTQAQSIPTATYREAAASGVRLRASFFTEVHPDCTSSGLAKVSIVANPSHGAVLIIERKGYPDYPRSNQRYDCNKTPAPGIAVYYISEKGYIGTDTFTVSVITPTGSASQRVYIITVAP